jgi:C_GCAxxG_C_C family probable redox protein
VKNSKKAQATFKNGFSCSQAVLSTFAENVKLDKKTALKLADSFGGGMAIGHTCGVVTAAYMVIGLKYGRTAAKDKKSKQKTTRLGREFIQKFEKRNKTIICKDLLGCNIHTKEGAKYAKDHKLSRKLCRKYVANAVEILEDIL